MLMPRVYGSLHIISVQQHSLNIGKNGNLNTKPIDQTTLAPSSNTKVSIGKERNAIEGEGTTIDKEHHVPEGEVMKSKRRVTDDTQTHPKTATNKTFDAHQPRESKDPEVSDVTKITANDGADQNVKATLGQARNTIE